MEYQLSGRWVIGDGFQRCHPRWILKDESELDRDGRRDIPKTVPPKLSENWESV